MSISLTDTLEKSEFEQSFYFRRDFHNDSRGKFSIDGDPCVLTVHNTTVETKCELRSEIWSFVGEDVYILAAFKALLKFEWLASMMLKKLWLVLMWSHRPRGLPIVSRSRLRADIMSADQSDVHLVAVPGTRIRHQHLFHFIFSSELFYFYFPLSHWGCVHSVHGSKFCCSYQAVQTTTEGLAAELYYYFNKEFIISEIIFHCL